MLLTHITSHGSRKVQGNFKTIIWEKKQRAYFAKHAFVF